MDNIVFARWIQIVTMPDVSGYIWLEENHHSMSVSRQTLEEGDVLTQANAQAVQEENGPVRGRLGEPLGSVRR